MTQRIEMISAFAALFISGADEDHTADEMTELIADVNWEALKQAMMLEGKPVYEFLAVGAGNPTLSYRSNDLFGLNAIRLDEDLQYPRDKEGDSQIHTYSLELWVLEDFSFAITSCFRMKIGNGTYFSEYRTIKAYDWQETEMDVDFVGVADEIYRLCDKIEAHGYPMIEV